MSYTITVHNTKSNEPIILGKKYIIRVMKDSEGPGSVVLVNMISQVVTHYVSESVEDLQRLLEQ